MFSERVQSVVERYMGKRKNEHIDESEEKMEMVGKIPHERKQEDAFQKEFSAEVQDIVNRYTEKYKK